MTLTDCTQESTGFKEPSQLSRACSAAEAHSVEFLPEGTLEMRSRAGPPRAQEHQTAVTFLEKVVWGSSSLKKFQKKRKKFGGRANQYINSRPVSIDRGACALPRTALGRGDQLKLGWPSLGKAEIARKEECDLFLSRWELCPWLSSMGKLGERKPPPVTLYCRFVIVFMYYIMAG